MNMNYKVLALLHIAAPNSNLAAWKLLVKNLLDLEKVNLNNENIYALSFYNVESTCPKIVCAGPTISLLI